MSLLHGLDWQWGELDFKGYSIAGQTTSVVFRNPKICFDIGQGLPFHLNSKLFCLTHMHADHGGGLSYLLSQRSLFRLPRVNIMLPKDFIDPVHRILKESMAMEGFHYSYDLLGVDETTSFDFSEQYQVKTFPTTHRVKSFGYLVYEKKKKLKAQYSKLQPQQLIELKAQGKEIEESIEEPLVAFTGDTQIEFINAHPDVTKAKVLLMECTYLDDRKSVAAAREWGHIHLDEIMENINHFQNQHISLIHLSARYSSEEAKKILKQRIPKDQHSRWSLFPRPI